MEHKITAREIFDQQDKADKEKIADFLRGNMTSKRIFRHDFTQQFYDDLLKRRDSKILQHVVLTTWGFTGNYKTGSMIEIARTMDINFSAEKIAFTNQQLLDLTEHQHSKGFILRDEQTKEQGTGSGMQQAFLQMQAETLRASEISFGYCSPTLKRIGTEHYILHCLAHNQFKLDDEGNALEPVYVLMGCVNPMTDNYLGGVIIPIEWMNPVWKQYISKKQAFMESVKNRQFAKADFDEMAIEVLKSPKAKFCKNNYDWSLLIQEVQPGLTVDMNKMLSARIKMMSRIRNGITNGEDYGDDDDKE